MQDFNTEAIQKCFWKRLQELLIERNKKSQIEQYTFLGVSKNTIRNWEHGKCLPRYYDMLRISRLLGCSIEYLLDETVKMKSASEDVQSSVITTGLSEKAIEVLKLCHTCGGEDILNTLNSMIISDIQIFKMAEGRWMKNNRPDPFAATIRSDEGNMIQVTGIIGALQNNLEASIGCEDERNKYEKILKAYGEDIRHSSELMMQDNKLYMSHLLYENSSYKMMLVCTMATSEGQQYHEILKESYKKGDVDYGKR